MKRTAILRQQELAAAKAQRPSTRKPLSAEALAARERYLATLKRIGQPEIVSQRYEAQEGE